MIPRYTREEMQKVWSEDNKFKKWLEVEIASLEGWCKIGVIPEQTVKIIEEKAVIDIKRIKEIESITHHDVIAFVEQVSEGLGKDGRYLHYGLTSSDVLDTAQALILKEASSLLIRDVELLGQIIKEKALEYKYVPMIGRTHGVHAEPITLGFKFAGWYFETLRNLDRLKSAAEQVSFGKISGAVGTYSNLEPEVEKIACEKLGLKPENFSTQIISRDRHAAYLTTLGIIAASTEKMALQIRLMQQTEISELAEPFSKGQKGSSAMPHKRNPILCERICGLSGIIKKNAITGLDNVALWYERDISHSSAERIIFPESTILLDYILNLMIRVLKDINVFEENMQRNLSSTKGLVFSQAILTCLVKKGLTRKEAYELVQKCAFSALQQKKNFSDVILNDKFISKHLEQKEIEECLSINHYLRHIDCLFKKIEGTNKAEIATSATADSQ